MGTTTSPNALVAAGLRRSVRNCLEGEAAVELLIGYESGRLLDGPWIVRTPVLRRYQFRPAPEDYDTHGQERSGLSERDALVLQVAASVTSIAFPGVPVTALLDLDRTTLALVLTAYAHIACRVVENEVARHG
ncbi:hypothetical protein ACIO3S_17950 [Nocardioides sp. NPDC087217]|uniref:hypothetical protein n=1 Tax=Nocardioides sp. NPDC087217 TaxID=3364335 RepID=UPI00381046B9